MGADEFEIWGLRLSASSGNAIGSDQRLSDMGPEGNASHIAQIPAIAYSGLSNNQSIIVWSGDDTTQMATSKFGHSGFQMDLNYFYH